MKAKIPTAILFSENPGSPEILRSDIYFEENLQDDVKVYRYRLGDHGDFYPEYAIRSRLAMINPDIIMCVGESAFQKFTSAFDPRDTLINNKLIKYEQEPPRNILANDIVCQSTFSACSINQRVYRNTDLPYFSVFTGAYQSGERLSRAYKSLQKQSYPNWEWIIVDDSPEEHEETYEIAKSLSLFDNRVKVYRMDTNSGGNVGEVKHMAASLANGGWLVELDHDDELMPSLLEECVLAIKKHPDAGFIYTDVCELYEDGEMRPYGMIAPNREWYGHPANRFAWGYAGHEWVDVGSKKYLSHIYPEINPKTIRFNIGMPNHARVWRSDVYHQVGGHNRSISVADDFELIVKTFLNTRFIHIRKMLYLQYNNRNSTVDNNSIDINRRSRLIKDHYDQQIHQRIEELDRIDTCWIEEEGRSGRLQNDWHGVVHCDEEQVLNYIIE